VGIQLDCDILTYRNRCFIISHRNGERTSTCVSVDIGSRKLNSIYTHRELTSTRKTGSLYNGIHATVIKSKGSGKTCRSEAFARIGVHIYIRMTGNDWRFVILNSNNRGTGSCLAIAIIYRPYYRCISSGKYFSRKGVGSVKVVGNAAIGTVVGKSSIEFSTYNRVFTYPCISITGGISHASDYWSFVIFNSDNGGASGCLAVAVVHDPHYCSNTFRKNFTR